MLVSIIVPFYNVEPYFRRCLDSIVNQSYQNLEIILINDCSPDNSIDIAREYAQKDSRIHIIEHEKSLHVGGARNSGMASATGEYIWFIDSDDEIATPYAVEHLVAVARRDESDIILFRAQAKLADDKKFYLFGDYMYDREYIFNENNPFVPIYQDVLLHDHTLYAAFTPAVWMKFFKTSFLKKYHFAFLEQTVHQDIPTLMLLPLAKRITQLPYIFYYYYQREGSTMNSKAPEQYMQHFERIAQQLWGIYDSYWDDWDRKKLVVPSILMNHLLYNTRRTVSSLSKVEYESWLVDVYDFFKKQLENRITFEDFNPWPSVVSHKEEWRVLFNSFKDRVNDKRKTTLIANVLEPRPAVSYRFKRAIKMLLPYGVVRLIQIIKSR